MFKTVMLVWKCLNGTAPGYLSELCVPVASVSGCQHLRSASTGILQFPRAHTMVGWWSFAVAGPSLWNILPAALQRPELTLHTFKRQLKAYLFHIWCAGEQKEHSSPPALLCDVFVILVPDIKLQTYLLTYVAYVTKEHVVNLTRALGECRPPARPVVQIHLLWPNPCCSSDDVLICCGMDYLQRFWVPA